MALDIYKDPVTPKINRKTVSAKKIITTDVDLNFMTFTGNQRGTWVKNLYRYFSLIIGKVRIRKSKYVVEIFSAIGYKKSFPDIS